jgi:predicted transcriptional regulator
MSEPLQQSDPAQHGFTFLTNYSHVLLLIAEKPDIRMRELATTVGITERAVQRIVEDLTSSGYLRVTKEGRRNHYEIQSGLSLRHHLASHRSVGDLIAFMNSKWERAYQDLVDRSLEPGHVPPVELPPVESGLSGVVASCIGG